MPPKNHMKRVQDDHSTPEKDSPKAIQTKQPTATSLPEPLVHANTASPSRLRKASETVASTDREYR